MTMIPNIEAEYSGEKIIAHEEADHDEIINDAIDIVGDFHLEYSVLKVKVVSDHSEVDEFEVYGMLVPQRG